MVNNKKTASCIRRFISKYLVLLIMVVGISAMNTFPILSNHLVTKDNDIHSSVNNRTPIYRCLRGGSYQSDDDDDSKFENVFENPFANPFDSEFDTQDIEDTELKASMEKKSQKLPSVTTRMKFVLDKVIAFEENHQTIVTIIGQGLSEKLSEKFNRPINLDVIGRVIVEALRSESISAHSSGKPNHDEKPTHMDWSNSKLSAVDDSFGSEPDPSIDSSLKSEMDEFYKKLAAIDDYEKSQSHPQSEEDIQERTKDRTTGIQINSTIDPYAYFSNQIFKKDYHIKEFLQYANQQDKIFIEQFLKNASQQDKTFIQEHPNTPEATRAIARMYDQFLMHDNTTSYPKSNWFDMEDCDVFMSNSTKLMMGFSSRKVPEHQNKKPYVSGWTLSNTKHELFLSEKKIGQNYTSAAQNARIRLRSDYNKKMRKNRSTYVSENTPKIKFTKKQLREMQTSAKFNQLSLEDQKIVIEHNNLIKKLEIESQQKYKFLSDDEL